MLTPLAPLNLAFELSKIDEERRYVGGYATDEELDKQYDIVDYDASVRAFSESPGNIRETHDAKKAVGAAIEIRPEPDSKPETVEKGEGPIRASRVTANRLDEVSLVNNRARPSATIQRVKAVDGESTADGGVSPGAIPVPRGPSDQARSSGTLRI